MKGKSSLTLTKAFNKAQREAHESFSNTPEITLIHGPFGSGKTRLLISLAVETMSNPDCKNQILYTVESNKPVDEVALRMDKMCKDNQLNKKIIRAHTLKGEKSEGYKYFDRQHSP